ncbi:TetR/AcrR family transcriptional regulator [uncultured Jatrophihabitans sp.]|uniref:TetR/AcrR family transcriptional regulator n=1 Tax=uncultured Jatrophihabitans sp. TaxID=1610747 RepID=UPI0035CB8542
MIAEPSSRRDRPAKPALTRSAIVSTAQRIMDADGLERVTMRRLAHELDTGPASFYVYFANTAELHAAILDELTATSWTDPKPTKKSWERSLLRMLIEYTQMLYEYPALARSAMTLRPNGPNHLRLVDALLTALRVGGVAPRDAAWGVDILIQTATATACEQSGRDESATAQLESSAQREALGEADDHTHPGIAWARDELFSGTGRQRLEWAFRTQLAGLRDGVAGAAPVNTGEART